MYLNNNMLIEFECDRNLDLPSPYAELIYKCINELLINALKHSKGYSTDIILKTVSDKINLKITNYGDYLEDEEKIVDGNIGLNILRLNLREYGGKFDFYFSKNCDLANFLGNLSTIQPKSYCLYLLIHKFTHNCI